jgi:hypothetical protein
MGIACFSGTAATSSYFCNDVIALPLTISFVVWRNAVVSKFVKLDVREFDFTLWVSPNLVEVVLLASRLPPLR